MCLKWAGGGRWWGGGHICQLVCKFMRVPPSDIQSGCHLSSGCDYEVPMKCGSWAAMQNKGQGQARDGLTHCLDDRSLFGGSHQR